MIKKNDKCIEREEEEREYDTSTRADSKKLQLYAI